MGLRSEHPGCLEGELLREGIQDETCRMRECGEKVAQGTACQAAGLAGALALPASIFHLKMGAKIAPPHLTES